MIALAAASQVAGARRCATSSSITPANFVGIEGSPITPVEARNTSEACSRRPRRRPWRSALSAARPRLAGESIGIARIDHQRARLARLELRAAPVNRRGRAFRAGEHAGHRRARLEQRQQHVGAARRNGCRPRAVASLTPRPAACRERARARGARRGGHASDMPARASVRVAVTQTIMPGASLPRGSARRQAAPAGRRLQLKCLYRGCCFFGAAAVAAGRRLGRPACRDARSWRSGAAW